MRRRFTAKGTLPVEIDKALETEKVCPICGAELEVEPESGELHCPVCEENGAP